MAFQQAIFVFFVLITTTAKAEIIFDHIKDEAWKQEVIETMDWVNSQLPVDWVRPDNVTIVYVEGQENAYYPILHYKEKDGTPTYAQQVLVVGNDNKAIFIHEYAHAIQDYWMRQNSLPWQYFVVWQEFGYNDLAEVLQERIDKLPSLKAANADYKKKKAEGNKAALIDSAIEHTGKTILQYEKAIADISTVLKNTEQYPYSLTAFNSMKALAPYNELFADTLAALVLQDWQALRDGLALEVSKMPLESLVLPPLDDPQAAMAQFLEYRDFVQGLSIASYSFQDWEASSNYWQFKPFRSEFRNWVEKENLSVTQAIDSLGTAIFNVYEQNLMPFPEKVDQTLFEKNQELKQAVGF